MAYYRLYMMDRFSGHIDHVREFEATDDGGAVAVAQGWHEGAPMELWSRHHKVKRWTEAQLADLELHA